MRFEFIKMQACGNDFLFLDFMECETPKFFAKEIQWICDRHYGLGADGLVLLRKGEKSHAAWTFYNSDGSEAEMCGNAARCAVLFLQERYYPLESPIAIETKAGVVRGRKVGPNLVELALFPLGDEKYEYKHRVIPVGERNIELYTINTGVPHAVIEVKDIHSFPINQMGKALVGHPAFGEKGTNVTFYQRLVGSRIRSTTFERGVEKETFACGTGVAAAAMIFSEVYLQQFPVEVNAPGGDIAVDCSPVSKWLLITGPAEYVYSITIENVPSNFDQPVLYGERRR